MPNDGRLGAGFEEASEGGGAPAGPLYSVELNIEELVLHGFDAADGRRVGEAVGRELARLFEEQGVPRPLTRSGEHASPGGLSFDVAADARPETVGAQIAFTIYGGLSE